ncbi:MAG: GNAT family protein [Pedobacter sp.]|uniref:GNAT family N-acetyltransferase n=1 Tax=Pedobacter sp. TaxID=1411316 RepID=UPI0035644A26
MNLETFLESERIYLRALNESDIKGNYALWLNDPEITYFNAHGRFPMTEDKLLSYISSVNSSKSDLVLAIIDRTNNQHIGNISLQNINWIDSNAEIAFLLGDKSYWGKGIMYEAGCLMVNHGFKFLNLHRIYCGTSVVNLGMQKLAEKLGMRKEGLRRHAIFKHGQYVDIVEYGILSSEL